MNLYESTKRQVYYGAATVGAERMARALMAIPTVSLAIGTRSEIYARSAVLGDALDKATEKFKMKDARGPMSPYAMFIVLMTKQDSTASVRADKAGSFDAAGRGQLDRLTTGRMLERAGELLTAVRGESSAISTTFNDAYQSVGVNISYEVVYLPADKAMAALGDSAVSPVLNELSYLSMVSKHL